MSLRDFDGTDSFTVSFDGRSTAPITRGTNYTIPLLQREIQGASEVQTVALTGNETGDSHTLVYNGSETVPLVNGQNYTAAGIANALQGGNEQQQVVLTGFSQDRHSSFQVEIGGNTSAVLGAGGLAVNNGNVAGGDQRDPRLRGDRAVGRRRETPASRSQFDGASQNTDVPAISIVNCTGTCVATVRETAKGGDRRWPSWPAGGTVGRQHAHRRRLHADVQRHPSGHRRRPAHDRHRERPHRRGRPRRPRARQAISSRARRNGASPGWGGNTLYDTGFQVTFGAGSRGGARDLAVRCAIDPTGATGFVGETAQGGSDREPRASSSPTRATTPSVVETAPPRSPSRRARRRADRQGDRPRWRPGDLHVGAERPRRGGRNGSGEQRQVDGPLFRVFGTAANVGANDTLKYASPGENAVTTDRGGSSRTSGRSRRATQTPSRARARPHRRPDRGPT